MRDYHKQKYSRNLSATWESFTVMHHSTMPFLHVKNPNKFCITFTFQIASWLLWRVVVCPWKVNYSQYNKLLSLFVKLHLYLISILVQSQEEILEGPEK